MTDNMGRGVFATRNLKKGELIIFEKPIAIGSKCSEEEAKIEYGENKSLTGPA